MVLHHAFDVQILNRDYAEPIDQPAGLLMHKVMATVLNAFMHPPNNLLGLLTLL